MHFRDASLNDLPKIVSIYNTTIASRMVTADTSEVTVESRRKWFDEHSSDKRPLWMVSVDGAEIGWVSFQSFYGRPAYDGTVEISIYLDPSARGKGYGKVLMEKSIQQCEKIFGPLPVQIGAQLYLEKFYTSLGFTRTSDIYLEDGIEHIEMRSHAQNA